MTNDTSPEPPGTKLPQDAIDALADLLIQVAIEDAKRDAEIREAENHLTSPHQPRSPRRPSIKAVFRNAPAAEAAQAEPTP